jgi:hypothetical protein
MSTIVSRTSVLLGAISADVPVGTNLGLLWLLWALVSGRFLLSRGASRRWPMGDCPQTPSAALEQPWRRALGHPDARTGMAPGGPAGRPLARLYV